ncbi:hypothetical protein LU276_01155 [Moraxella haemolytica]|uniref:hypothetical protein n=1 Tax=Moraxella haemolytica TaxID=2904119 RepID=UPI002542DC7B|nr:hypothetical protein [Moraxella sp. ZY171148]WII95490.1 hypothetical protein LU276_01155 [Moraxella sp. ZY171148]
MDLQGYLPLIVVLGVAGFLLGNIFALKPKAGEVRVADFRLLARTYGFNPKLIPRPDWLPTRVQQHSHHAPKNDLVVSYGVVCDEWRLSFVRLIVKDGKWCVVDADKGILYDKADGVTLPVEIMSHALGLQVKANSVVLYWQDVHYQSSRGVQKLDKKLAQADLQTLKQALLDFGNQLNQRA